jgi:hypothetical protein
MGMMIGNQGFEEASARNKQIQSQAAPQEIADCTSTVTYRTQMGLLSTVYSVSIITI